MLQKIFISKCYSFELSIQQRFLKKSIMFTTNIKPTTFQHW